MVSALRRAEDLHSPGWGWAGVVSDFLATEPTECMTRLRAHHIQFAQTPPSDSQVRAWETSLPVLARALRQAAALNVGALDWGLVFEYELPLEGGRRPDLVVLAGASVAVVEFKQETRLPVAYFDQVAGYARDLAEYHSETRGRDVLAVLAPVSEEVFGTAHHDVVLAPPPMLGSVLAAQGGGDQIDLVRWTDGGYAPLPTLVSAARRIFREEPLPHVKRALAARIPETINLISDLAREAGLDSRRRLVLLGGAPGAGKTLVGLRVVYEHANEHAPASFLSGNGPLVEVLQDALQSRVFVRDLHAYIRTYGMQAKTPDHNVIVFDEAQRAWDARYMLEKRGVDRSEPDLLIDTGDRMPGWATLVGLVGQGQEIYSGEEGGLSQWAQAIGRSSMPWQIMCSPEHAEVFDGLDVTTYTDLQLRIPLRARRAEQLDVWVSLLLEGALAEAADRSIDVNLAGFPIRFTRDLAVARAYARDRYEGRPSPLYGLLASSQAKNLAQFGIDNTFQATKRVRVARWFNDPASSPLSGCALTQPITEFQCQGLELDLPVVCWGDDFTWNGGEWVCRPVRRRYPQNDPAALLVNSYRVLLTRGRDGMVIFVPPDAALDETASALVAAGVSTLD